MAAVSQQMNSLRTAFNRFQSRPLGQQLFATAALATFVSTVIWSVNDYREFISLGKGGLPSNVFGWALITLLLRPIALSKRGAFLTADYPAEGAHQDVLKLPTRKGDRPVAKGIVPHRQMSQQAPEKMRTKISGLFTQAVEKYPNLVYIKKSLYERHNDGLFVNDSLVADPKSQVSQTARISRGEIGHMHGDMSVHLYLSPADAKLAIERGWAERHLLARPKPPFGKYIFRLAPTYLLFYGPRDEEDLETFKVFLENSIKFMTGSEDIHLTTQ